MIGKPSSPVRREAARKRASPKRLVPRCAADPSNIVDGDDVVDILLARLQRLSPVTQHWMRLAACLGNAFDLSTLAVVGSATRAEAAHGPLGSRERGARAAHRRGLPSDRRRRPDRRRRDGVDVRYQFRHDRVQQAAYALVPDGEKRALHLHIGRHLYSALGPAEREERIIEIVRHLDIGAALLDSDAERVTLRLHGRPGRARRDVGRRTAGPRAHDA
jgi:predicted ATPase